MQRKYLLWVLLLFINLISSTPLSYALSRQSINFEVKYGPPELKPYRSPSGRWFTEVIIPEIKSRGEIGEPALPVEGIQIPLPFNAIFERIEVKVQRTDIDGKYLETSPIEKPITIAAGEHILTLKNPNYSTITDTVEVYPGMTINKKFNFMK